MSDGLQAAGQHAAAGSQGQERGFGCPKDGVRRGNVVLSDISKKNGHVITFIEYLKVGFPLMMMTVVISAIYMYFRFPM